MKNVTTDKKTRRERDLLWHKAKALSAQRQKIARARGENSAEAKRAWLKEQEAWRKVGL